MGTAWLVSGLTPRTDVTVTTIEYDPVRAELARRGDWPEFVEFRTGDALDALPGLGTYDLIFADARAGKHDRLDLTLDALRPGGTLVVDDMTEDSAWPADLRERQQAVRRALTTHPALAAVELTHGSGVILATRRGT